MDLDLFPCLLFNVCWKNPIIFQPCVALEPKENGNPVKKMFLTVKGWLKTEISCANCVCDNPSDSFSMETLLSLEGIMVERGEKIKFQKEKIPSGKEACLLWFFSGWLLVPSVIICSVQHTPTFLMVIYYTYLFICSSSSVSFKTLKNRDHILFFFVTPDGLASGNC